jgi:hypothetical protein
MFQEARREKSCLKKQTRLEKIGKCQAKSEGWRVKRMWIIAYFDGSLGLINFLGLYLTSGSEVKSILFNSFAGSKRPRPTLMDRLKKYHPDFFRSVEGMLVL